MLIAYLPALVMLIGLLLFVLSPKPKAVAVGQDMFWCGLLVTLIVLGTHVVKVGG